MARAAVALLALALLGAAGEREITGKVVSVADGDTLTVLVGEQPVRVAHERLDQAQVVAPVAPELVGGPIEGAVDHDGFAVVKGVRNRRGRDYPLEAVLVEG